MTPNAGKVSRRCSSRRSPPVQAADLARSESDRARKAEVQLVDALLELTAEKARRAEAEAERRCVQAEAALVDVGVGRELTEQESKRAREAEERVAMRRDRERFGTQFLSRGAVWKPRSGKKDYRFDWTRFARASPRIADSTRCARRRTRRWTNS